MDEDKRNGENPNLDEEMERDTEIRRDTQVRGSLGIPPSGRSSSESESGEGEEAVPEFDRGSDEDRTSDR